MRPEPESDRWLAIAEKLLAASDLLGSRRFAERALESDPINPSDRADRIIAVADVVLASQTRIHSQPDPHSILGCKPGSDPKTLLSSYRRLSRLLNPSSNRLPFADHASKLVADAYTSLSGPAARSRSASTSANSFWTVCTNCCHIHLYERAYVGMNLKCRKCEKGFRAEELGAPPPIVEGTDMYYCTWGYFPMGVGGPAKKPAAAQAVRTPVPATKPAVKVGRVKKMAGRKRKSGLGRQVDGGIDINQGFDDDGADDDSDYLG